LSTPLIAFAGRGVGEAGGTGVGDAPAKPDEGPVTPWHPAKNRDNATTNKTNDICKNAFVAVLGPIQITSPSRFDLLCSRSGTWPELSRSDS
jgi:hypothetical protein